MWKAGQGEGEGLHSLAGADFVALEDVPPLVLSVLGFDGKGFEDLGLLREDLGVVFWSAVEVAQDLQGFLVAALFVAVPRRLGEAKDEEDDDLDS